MSDLRGLDTAGIAVTTLIRNPTYSGRQMAEIKAVSGPLTRDAEWYVSACDQFNSPVSEPFDNHNGGITATWFFNQYPQFEKTNDLSLVVFIKFAGFKILFPGDLEGPGWRALLDRADFRAELMNTNVLVASHHGRLNGFCEEIFNYFTPNAIVISAIVYLTKNGLGHTYNPA